jgi:hypothetical protein
VVKAGAAEAECDGCGCYASTRDWPKTHIRGCGATAAVSRQAAYPATVSTIRWESSLHMGAYGTAFASCGRGMQLPCATRAGMRWALYGWGVRRLPGLRHTIEQPRDIRAFFARDPRASSFKSRGCAMTGPPGRPPDSTHGSLCRSFSGKLLWNLVSNPGRLGAGSTCSHDGSQHRFGGTQGRDGILSAVHSAPLDPGPGRK